MKKLVTLFGLALVLTLSVCCLFACVAAIPGDGDGSTLSLTATGAVVHEGTSPDGATWKIYADGSMVVDGTVDTMYNYDLNGETPAWKQYASEDLPDFRGECQGHRRLRVLRYGRHRLD